MYFQVVEPTRPAGIGPTATTVPVGTVAIAVDKTGNTTEPTICLESQMLPLGTVGRTGVTCVVAEDLIGAFRISGSVDDERAHKATTGRSKDT